MRLIRLAVIVALVCPLVVAGAITPARSQTAGDSSFTGGIFDSFGAKTEVTGGLHFDPVFAYVQSVALEQAPLATAHGYVVFPGTLGASTIITSGAGASPDYPRFGGQLPLENICGDPGNLKRGEPELRNPRRHDRPEDAPYDANCEGDGKCPDLIRRGNPISSEERQEFARVWGNQVDFATTYGVSECNAAKLYGFSDQRVTGVKILALTTRSSGAPGPAAPAVPQVPSGSQPGGGLLPQPGSSVLPTAVSTGVGPQQTTTTYAISMGSATSFSKLEVLGPGLTGAPAVEGDLAGPALATTGAVTDWITVLGLVALASSFSLWGLSRRIGGGRSLTLIAATVLAGANIIGFAPRADSAEPTRIVGTVTSRATDVVITTGAVELFRIAEVTVIAKAEANGQPGGAKTEVTRTIRGVKVGGQDQADLSQDKINERLGGALSFKLGDVIRTAESDGSAASVDATGLLLEFTPPQGIPVTVSALPDPPKYKLTLAKATPSVSFFSLASILGAGGVDFGSGLTQEFSGTEGEQSGAGGAATGGTFATPQDTSVPGVKQVGPGQYVLQGKFAGFEFEGMKLKLWPLKDILEAAGGILLIIAVALAVRHRRRFAAPKPA